MDFDVTITETLQKTVSIQAETKEEAEKIVKELWNDGEIVLSADDFADVEYITEESKELEKSKDMEVLLVKPGHCAEMTTIGADLESMQAVVGGQIEAAYYFDEPVAVICNEEGKINGMEANRAIKDDSGNIVDIVAGTFFVCGLGEDSFTSLPSEHREKFEKMFKNPEAFLRMGKGIMVIPVEPQFGGKEKTAENKNHGKEL